MTQVSGWFLGAGWSRPGCSSASSGRRLRIWIAILGLALGGCGGVAWATSCTGTQLTYVETGNGADQTVCLANGVVCQKPTAGAPSYNFDVPGCDPFATTCGMRATVATTFPGNHQNDPGASGFTYSYGQVQLATLSGSLIGQCGAAGAVIAQDQGTATVTAGVSCANSGSLKYRLDVTMCPTLACAKATSVNLDFAQAAGCPTPPPDDCDSCQMCRLNGGGGGGPGCSSPVRGGGPACHPGGAGPGAHLQYRAGGAGGTALPGATAWRAALGLFWSHEHAQRILLAPDLNHVWMITDKAGFREFSNLAAGSGLRLYQTTGPSDDYRKLYYDSVTGGWQLDSLNGRKDFFRPDGLWDKTVFAQNPTHPIQSTYNGSNQLVAVSFPDGRSETLAYNGAGKLSSITEVPVAGSGTPSRTWTYIWSGDVLTNIGRPDGTAWEFTYDPAKNGGRAGYVSQIRLIGTDGVTGRVEVAYEYDSFGNVIHAWSGDPVFTGPNAVNRQEFTYTNPQFPTRTDVKEWIDATQGEVTTYEFDRDPQSLKARINKITGDCPACGMGPNSQLTYGDAANPLLPTQILDGRGLKTQQAYDTNGRTTSRTEAVGTPLVRTTAWQYGNASFPALPTQIQLPSISGGAALRVTTLGYDASGNLATRTLQGAEGGSSFSFATATTFNSSGQPLTVDPPGYGTADVTSYTYDPARGNLLPLTRTDPLISATSYAYDGFNRRTSVTDPNGIQTVTAYDGLDRVTVVTRKGTTPAEDLTTTYFYTLFGDLLRTVLPRGNVIEYGYDPAARLVTIERKPDAATHGERTLYTLDVFGHRTREDLQHWNGSAWVSDSFTSYVYSTRCHLDKTVYADGSATEYTYDCDNNLSQVWDANHPRATNPTPTQTYAYDELNRLTFLMQPWAGAGGGTATTAYGYDVQDHLNRVTDAEGNTTTFTYGDRDLMTAQLSPATGTTTYAYNEHGELTTEIDARGITMTRTIDAQDRATAVAYPDISQNTAYTYDDPLVSFSKGRLTRIARNGVNVDYRYDRFGRLLQDGELAYTWDTNGNPATIVYPGNVTAIYGYDFADRPASLLARRPSLPDQPLVTAAAYLPSGPLSSLTLGNSLAETRSFTNRYFPSSITLGGTGSLLSWTYTTDSMGNIKTIGDGLNAANNRAYNYQDIHYFLTQGNGPWGPRSWTYDKIGNRLTETRGTLTDLYTYSSSTGGGHSPTLSQIQLAAGGTRTYQFGPAGHLMNVATGSDATLFTNDVAGHLAALERTSLHTGTAFRYDGRGYLTLADASALPFQDGFESGNVCAWSAALGLTTMPNCTAPLPPAVHPTYSSEGLLHALQRNAAPDRSLLFHFAGRPLAQLDLSGTTESWKYLITDHLGTPIAATSTVGASLWQGGFEPFGADWSGAGGTGVFMRLPGQWVDQSWSSVTGIDLLANVHRWYEARTGRYTTSDPIPRVARSFSHGLLIANSEAEYPYARLNPLVFIDPFGLASAERALCITKWVAVGAGAGAVTGGVIGAGTAGGACTLVAPGVGTIGCGAGGAYGGAAVGGAIGGTIGGFLGSLSCPNDCTPDSEDRRRKTHEHCLRLYEICVSSPGRHKFEQGKRCGDCFGICRAEGAWPFDMCSLNYYPHGV